MVQENHQEKYLTVFLQVSAISIQHTLSIYTGMYLFAG